MCVCVLYKCVRAYDEFSILFFLLISYFNFRLLTITSRKEIVISVLKELWLSLKLSKV